WSPEIAIHFAHRAGALIVSLFVLATAVSARRGGNLRRLAAIMVFLVIVQVLLGAAIVWTGRHPIVASIHVVVGAVLLATSMALTVKSRRGMRATRPSSRPAFAPGEVPA
ncbi:MAG TPA: COX15/CtaA family protein, partial [Candidatus Eisenbacteria bacterium]|nr:COX15/CtaA family protein [Candidatus Eisenbacteria bacterium]